MGKEKDNIVYYTKEGFIVATTGGWEDKTLSDKYDTITTGWVNSETFYVEDGTLKPKADWSPLVQGNSIINIPVTSRVYVEGQELKITDGVLELDKHPSHEIQVMIASATHLTKKVIL